MARLLPVARRPPTIRDVAERAGVSTATVSRILSGALSARPATRERVLEAVHELGYRPSGVARSLKLRATATLGLIVTDIENPFFPELVRSIEDAAREREYSVLFCNGDEDPDREESYLELLAERRVDGIIVASSGLTERHGRWIAGALVPVVLVNCETSGGSRPAILSDNREGARVAAEHLLALGHRRLGLVLGQPANAATAERLGGVRDALEAAGLPPDELATARGDGHVAGGERATEELLRAIPGLTAIVCYNDLTAIGAIRAVRATGRRVPEDVSIVGFDDIDLARYVDPPLTTVAQQTARMGRWGVERLADLIRGANGAAHGAIVGSGAVRLPTTLRIRGSTVSPRESRPPTA